jgi:hypothetical protein
MYLPIEILWCPIVKVKDWGPIGSESPKQIAGGYRCSTYAGTEKSRDFLTRRMNVLGYSVFVCTTGCRPSGSLNRPHDQHTLIKAGGQCTGYLDRNEGGWRPNTRYRSVMTSNKASVWLAADHTPFVGNRSWNPSYRSHFGVQETIPGEWRYNVLHLDGHVHDDIWREAYVSEQWRLYRLNKTDLSPWVYGWKWVNASDNTARSTYGVEIKTDFVGAFDENK